jgi:hypothetical protein
MHELNCFVVAIEKLMRLLSLSHFSSRMKNSRWLQINEMTRGDSYLPMDPDGLCRKRRPIVNILRSSLENRTTIFCYIAQVYLPQAHFQLQT